MLFSGGSGWINGRFQSAYDMFAYLLRPEDGFEDRSKRTLFSSLICFSVLEVFIKIFLLVILLLPFRNQSASVLQAL